MIFIPEKIKVGYQNRRDTYTGRLAYVIYYDRYGKLRKEPSWSGWRDEKIEPDEYDNNPTEGFVLNKKVGGYCYHFDQRDTYVRVYDPRGFEFEISVPNLLYILEHANSIRGKGLEGEFVYGWDGTELVLVPVCSEEYKDRVSTAEKLYPLETECIKPSDLRPGFLYKSKYGEIVYMGKHDYYNSHGEKTGKAHYFFAHWAYSQGYSREDQWFMQTRTQLKQIVTGQISDTPYEGYADLVEQMERHTEYSPIAKEKEKYRLATFEEFKKHLGEYGSKCYSQKYGLPVTIYHNGDEYKIYEMRKSWRGYYERTEPPIAKKKTAEEVYKAVEPMMLQVYLRNDKLYQEKWEYKHD